jgi:hypothetical protein
MLAVLPLSGRSRILSDMCFIMSVLVLYIPCTQIGAGITILGLLYSLARLDHETAAAEELQQLLSG